MRKHKLFLIVMLCAIALGGCKKREAIDLSSLHTTAAVEKETLPASSDESVATSEAESSESTAATTALTTTLAKETVGSAVIEYPVISNLKDSEKQEKANALLKTNALAIADVHPEGKLTVQAAVASVNQKRITVTYRGELTNGSKTDRIFYANTIDLDTMKNLQLSDFTDPYTMAGYIASGDYKLSDVSGSEDAIRNTLKGTVDSYYKRLQTADLTGGYTEDSTKSPAADWPEIFSYEKQGVVYVSLPVPAEQGGYVIIHYSPDNK